MANYAISSVYEKIRSFIDSKYLESSDFLYKGSALSGAYSLIVCSKSSAYHLDTAEHLFAKLKLVNFSGYIFFSKTHESSFAEFFSPNQITYVDTFIRFDLDTFFAAVSACEDLRKLLNNIYLSSFSFSKFGCCSRYKECSDAKMCVHPDILYAAGACQYKRNINAGHIFYSSSEE